MNTFTNQEESSDRSSLRTRTSARASDGKVRRTNLDVLRFITERLCGSTVGEALYKHTLTHFQLSREAQQELTESEYQFAIRQVEKELPNFAPWLLDQNF